MDRNHDIVVIGSSMGGIEALGRLLGQMTADFPASIFIVQHTTEGTPSFLDAVLRRASKPS